MICGFLHPTFERWLKAIDDREPAVRRTMRAVLGGVAVAAGLAWYSTIYTLPKFEYNKLHPYTSWIPITAFLILRNITPSLRLKSLGLYGWLGCITLETYVLYVRMNIRPLLVRTHARTRSLTRRRRPAGNSTRGFCPRCPTPRYVPEPASMLYLFTDTHVPNHQTTKPPNHRFTTAANLSALAPPGVSADQLHRGHGAVHLPGIPAVQVNRMAARRRHPSRRRRAAAEEPPHHDPRRRLRLARRLCSAGAGPVYLIHRFILREQIPRIYSVFVQLNALQSRKTLVVTRRTVAGRPGSRSGPRRTCW